MGRGAAAWLSLAAALVGGAAALGIARGAGWLDRSSHTVVVERPAGTTAAPVVAATPLTAKGFAPAQIYRVRSPGVVTILSYFDAPATATSAGQGSGFVVSKGGDILTSAHVVTTAGQTSTLHRARNVYVEFSDTDREPAKLVGFDLYDDVAVLHVDPADHPLTPVPLGDSSRVVVGQPVAVIGSPFGDVNSLSVGVISAIGRSIPSLTSKYDLIDVIQTDASINHGNSGGPLFDAAGRVIGINAQIRSNGTTGGFEGVGFAVPIDAAKRSLHELVATGSVRYAYIGIRTEDLTPSIAKAYGYAAEHGALVDGVVAGGPGAKAGIRGGSSTKVFNGDDVTVGGDAIVAINGAPVHTSEDVVRIITEQLVPGETATFTLVRGSARRTVKVTLGARAPLP
ncbi:MAG TPA: trypsin-like peptidase domain-containing protein [Gaiellaceae bacterium]|nr:trypsin-like peptidase domain-containing protein [Gaiellaceae bacterium]